MVYIIQIMAVKQTLFYFLLGPSVFQMEEEEIQRD